MGQNINIDKLSIEILKKMDIYKNATIETVEAAVKETAAATVEKLKSSSPGAGSYHKSWHSKRDSSLRGKWRFSLVVCSKKPDYRLTHLLEYGHKLTRNGKPIGIGSVKAKPHIKDAEEFAVKELEEKLRRGL